MTTVAERLKYTMTERTRLKVRIEVYDEDTDRTRVDWIRGCLSFEEAQRRYIDARDESGLGASGFGDGDVMDEMGQSIARISYNGRLWDYLAWRPGMEPIAEAPSRWNPQAQKPKADQDPEPGF